MKFGLIALVLCALLADRAYAGPRPVSPWITGEPHSESRLRVNMRVVQDPIVDPDPVHHSGMVAQTEIAPNTTLGFGLLRASPKKLGSGDWRVEPGAPRSRKAAVSFQFKF